MKLHALSDQCSSGMFSEQPILSPVEAGFVSTGLATILAPSLDRAEKHTIITPLISVGC